MKPFQGLRPYIDPRDELSAKKCETRGSIQAEIAYPEEDIHLERRLFNIYTYARFGKSLDVWSSITPANEFMATLDKDEYNYLVRLFVQAKRFIGDVTDRESLEKAIHNIDVKVAKTFSRMALSARITDFVCRDKRISLPDFDNFDRRPQDTDEKTFLEDDYHMINTIVIITKILFPIFGEIINKIQNLPNGASYKDQKIIIAFGIMNSLIVQDFSIIINKLINYITEIIDKKLSDSPMVMFRGITEIGYVYSILANMIVKNLVNQDLYRDKGNLMTYIFSTLKKILISEPNSSSSSSITYKARIMPEQGWGDERNVSLLENAINVTDEPVETPILVKIAIDQFIEDYLVRNNIRRSLFDQAVGFYNIKLIQPTPINELLVAMFIADPIGSAYCIRYMNMEVMVKIIVLMQIYAMNKGFPDIVPMLSLIDTKLEKKDIDVVDNAIIVSDGKGSSGTINYNIHIKELTAHLNDFHQFKFDEMIKELCMFVVSTTHMYNVAPSILELGTTGNTHQDVNGQLRYDRNVIAEISRFIHHMLLTDPNRSITAN